MRLGKRKFGQVKRIFARLLVAAVLAWCVIDLALELRTFVTEYHGIAFYVKRPYLLVLCLVVAVFLGLVVYLTANYVWKRPGRKSPIVVNGHSRAKDKV